MSGYVRVDLSTRCLSTRPCHVEPTGVWCHNSGLSLPLRLTVGGRLGRFPEKRLWIYLFGPDSEIQGLADFDLAECTVVCDQSILVVNSVGMSGNLALAP